MVNRPSHINAYEFAVLSALRAQQLIKGCTPRVAGTHNAPTMAQMEVAAGQVMPVGGRRRAAASRRPDQRIRPDPAPDQPTG